jgi:hypothetical protein
MATKAERFKSDTQRAAHAGRAPAARKQAGKPATPRDGLPHNTAPRARKNSAYEFEVSEGRASRKSSRRSPTHLKTDAPLRLAAVERGSTPKQRAARATDKGG